MSERKTIHRVFWEWDFEKEERWLNEMVHSAIVEEFIMESVI